MSIELPIRKIIHIDMDCFYAAIEVRDNPSLRSEPVAVGERSGVRTGQVHRDESGGEAIVAYERSVAPPGVAVTHGAELRVQDVSALDRFRAEGNRIRQGRVRGGQVEVPGAGADRRHALGRYQPEMSEGLGPGHEVGTEIATLLEHPGQAIVLDTPPQTVRCLDRRSRRRTVGVDRVALEDHPALFELVERCDTPDFKTVARLVKKLPVP